MKKRVMACGVGAMIALAGTLWPQALRTTQPAQLKMAQYEDCRKTPYYCAAGVLTVGIGSTANVQQREYRDEEIAERWVNDMRRAENCVNRFFNGAAAPQRVFEAMTDVAFNVGCTGITWYTDKQQRKQRTTLWKYAQVGNWYGVCNRLTDFVNAGGKRLAGLVKRREEFKAWCLSEPALRATP